MRIELYVVRTKDGLKISAELHKLKLSLIHEYNGLSVIPSVGGYWINDKGILETDKVEIWSILKEHESEELQIITAYARELKRITQQQTQLFTIDNHPYFI